MKKILLIILFAGLLVGCTNSTNSTQMSSAATESNSKSSAETAVKIIGGDEESLREFIVRWFEPGFPGETAQQTLIEIGSIPDEWQLNLPMPDDARVIASIKGEWTDTIVMIDTSLPPDEVFSFYTKQLASLGWNPAPTDANENGFAPAAEAFRSFCSADGKEYLIVSASRITDEKTDLRLNLFTDADPSMCGEGVTEEINSLIPRLKAPQGTILQDGSEGGDEKSWEVSVQLKTSLSPVELAEHYNRQLETAGWELMKQGKGDGTAWSNWSFTDDQGQTWSGTLIVISTSEEGSSKYALVRIERNP